MSTRNTTIFSLLMIALILLIGVVFYSRLPVLMATHWNINDQVDGYMPRLLGVILLPMLALGLFLMLNVIPFIDPLKDNIAKFRNYYNLLIVLLTLFLVYLQGLTLAWNLGATGLSIGSTIFWGLGLLLIYMGVLMRKARRNWFIGIRTPWTLSSDSVWEKTHRVGGVLFILCGLLVLLGAFLKANILLFLVIPLPGSALFLVIYSLVLFLLESRP